MAIASPRSGSNAYPEAPIEWGDNAEWSRQIAQVANGVLNGKINATGTVTLTASQATTVMSDQRFGPNSIILLMPLTANASAEVGNGTIYISSRGEKTATVTHANNAQTDRNYGYCSFG